MNRTQIKMERLTFAGIMEKMEILLRLIKIRMGMENGIFSFFMKMGGS